VPCLSVSAELIQRRDLHTASGIGAGKYKSFRLDSDNAGPISNNQFTARPRASRNLLDQIQQRLPVSTSRWTSERHLAVAMFVLKRAL